MIEICKSLYKSLDLDNRSTFLELAQERYKATKPSGKKPPDAAWLDLFLSEYDPVTNYVYEHEVERKRDYTAEGVNSSTAKKGMFIRGLRYWARFTAHYADAVTDHATLKALEDSGVKRVMWHTQTDGHVCEICQKRSRKIYPINRVPPKPHWNCRCWVTAVIEK